MKQTTIKNEISFSGIGLHSAVKVNITLKQNLDCNGIIFRRVDKNNSEVVARYNNVVDTKLGTTISNGIEKVLTIEHLMSAIWACDIDNLIVEIDNQETPILDGSAINFINEIKKAGIVELEQDRKYLKILKEVEVVEGEKYVKLLPSDNFSIDISVNFPYGNIGKQDFVFDGNKDNFISNVSNARTFCNEKEIEYMRSVGLARGGSLDNAVVFSDTGAINDGGLRYENEVVRHKLLDCVGDLYICGYNIIGKCVSNMGGHTLNNQVLRKLFEDDSNYVIE